MSFLKLSDTLVNGQTSIATTGVVVQLPDQVVYGIRVKAFCGQGQKIYVGNSTVTSTNGYILANGEEVEIFVSNSNFIWIDGIKDDGVSFIAIT